MSSAIMGKEKIVGMEFVLTNVSPEEWNDHLNHPTGLPHRVRRTLRLSLSIVGSQVKAMLKCGLFTF
jgi:hypothetical protein